MDKKKAKARQEELKTFLDDNIVQIKRFKNRAKFELYVHNKDFLEVLHSFDVSIPGEEAEKAILYKKKVIFKHLNYGLFIQSLFKYISLNRNHWTKEDSYKILHFIEDEVTQLKNKSQEAGETSWDEIYLALKKIIETLIFESENN